MALPRRILLAVLALAALLAGCGSEQKEDITPLGPRKPLKVQHAMGETRVPYRSKEPLTQDPAALEVALALGVKPVASSTPDGRFPEYLGDRVRGIRNLGPPRDPDAAEILRIDPDVVIGNKLLQAPVYKRLEGKVPIVMSGIPIQEWKADVRFFGESLGRSDEGEALLRDYDGRVARTKRAIEGSRRSEGRLLRSLSPELRRELSPSFLADVFEDVGLKPPATTGRGRAGGLIAARLVLDDLARGARR